MIEKMMITNTMKLVFSIISKHMLSILYNFLAFKMRSFQNESKSHIIFYFIFLRRLFKCICTYEWMR